LHCIVYLLGSSYDMFRPELIGHLQGEFYVFSVCFNLTIEFKRTIKMVLYYTRLFIYIYIYRVIHKSAKHVRKLADATVEWRQWRLHLSTWRLPGSLQRRARVSQSKLATKVDRTNRKKDDVLMRWPLRSPDLTPCDFFFWVFVKDTVFVPPLPANFQIFATVSPLLWLWSTVICWHACGTRWTIA